MKRRRAVQLVALGGLTLPLAGCTDEASQADENSSETDADETADEDDADEDTGDGEEPDADDDEDEESADEPDEQEFSGSGDDAIEDVSIEGGFTVVDAAYEGEGEFEVRLIPEERLDEDDEEAADANENEDDAEEGGDRADEDADEEDGAESVLFVKSSFVDSSGEYEGQTAHPVDEGTYVLSVVADGDWEVTVRQPRAESGDEPPISLSGDGNEVHGPFEFDGSHQPSGDYDGERIVTNVYSPSGDTTVFAFNESNIENPSEFEFEGVGYVTVKSDGEWEVEIE